MITIVKKTIAAGDLSFSPIRNSLVLGAGALGAIITPRQAFKIKRIDVQASVTLFDTANNYEASATNQSDYIRIETTKSIDLNQSGFASNSIEALDSVNIGFINNLINQTGKPVIMTGENISLASGSLIGLRNQATAGHTIVSARLYFIIDWEKL